MRPFFFAILFLGTCFLANAFQNEKPGRAILISGQVNLDDQYSVYFTWKGPGALHPDSSEEVSIGKNGNFNWKSEIKTTQFVIISIQAKSRNRQLATTFPLLLTPGKEIVMKLDYSDSTYLRYISGNLDNNNQALLAYARLSIQEQINLFRNPPIADQFKSTINSYLNAVDSLVTTLQVQNDMVKKYLEIWAFNDYQEALFRYDRKSGENEKVVLPKSPIEVYDTDITLLFPQSYRFIDRYLDGLMNSEGRNTGLNAVKEKAALLQKEFTNPVVRDWITALNLKEVIRRYRVKDDDDFENQVKVFSKIAGNISDISKRVSLINDFKNLLYTKIGAPVPDVVFKNLKGKQVSLNNFKGKYVYIDLWASWCIPCIQEIPNLQKLEQDYKDKNIVFVSISIDEDAAAWKKKAGALKLKGHQLHAVNSDYATMMNISGIPHFLLYDPEGKLVMYNAPRPGALEIRKYFDSF